MEKDFLKRLQAGKIESIVLPLMEIIKENSHSVGGIVIDEGYWHDLGTEEEYDKLNKTGIGKVSLRLLPWVMSPKI